MLTYCRDTLIEELERCEYNRNFLLEHLDMLPHGTLKIKKKEGKEFLYYSYQKNKEKLKNILVKIPKKIENYLKSKTIDISAQKNQFKIIKN